MRNLPNLSHQNQIARHPYDIQHTSQYEAKDYPEVSIADYLYIFWHRKWLFLSPLALIMLFILADAMTRQPLYMASATVLIEDENPKILSVTEVSSPDKSPNFYTTQYEIIKSRIIAETAVDKLHLDDRLIPQEPSRLGVIKIVNNFLFHLVDRGKLKLAAMTMGHTEAAPLSPGDARAATSPSDAAEIYRQNVIKDLQSRIKVKPRDGTKLVDISIKSHDPVEAAQLVNTIAEAYVQKNLDDKLDTSRKAKEWLSKEAAALRQTIQNAEQELHHYKEEKQIIVDPTMDKIIVSGFDTLRSLQAAYTEKKRERILLSSEINELRSLASKNHNNLVGFDNHTLTSLRKKTIDLQGEYTELSNKLGHKHPKMITLRAEINELKTTIDRETQREIQQILGSMKNKYNAVLAQEHELENLLDAQKKALIRSEKDITEYESLRHGIEINKKMYGEVSRRLAETTLTTAITANNVKLVERALTGTPVSADTIIRLLIGLVLGLGCGGGLAFLADYRDKKFKNISEAEQYLGLPFLGFIPHHTLPKQARLASPRLVTFQEPWAPASESYRGIRTWVQLSQTPIKTLLIASAFPQEGRSITAANLAVSFAQLGHRVLLIDADLRQSSIHRFFGFDNTKGLTSLLENGLEWQSVLNDSPLANLKVLTAGPRPLNPTELLSTTRMKRLIETWKKGFDTIIFDVPVTFSSIPDTAILAPNMDGVLLVHDQSQVNRDAVLEGKKILERTGANLLGVIFNNITPKQEKHYYTYPLRHPYGQMHTAPDGNPELTCIDMRAITSPQQWVVDAAPTPLPVAQSAHSQGLTLTLSTVAWFSRIAGLEARANHMFLYLELEIINDGDFSHLFTPTYTVISVPEVAEHEPVIEPPGQTTRLNGDYNAALHTIPVYHYDALATRGAGGFADVVEIPAKSGTRGVIVYQTKEEHHMYRFEYSNNNINIAILFASQLHSDDISS